jgi:hypothetical protein
VFQAELGPFTDDLHGLRGRAAERRDLPVRVISGTLAPRLGGGLRRAIVAAHERRVALHSHGRHVRAERSGHYVLLTEPDLVVHEILELVREVSPATR